MSPQPIQFDAAHLDLSPRIFHSQTVAASPAAATETTICTVTIANDLAVTKGVYLFGWCAFTMGTSGVSATLKLRQTDTSGTTIRTSGAVTGVAAALYNPAILGVDTAPGSAVQVYVLTLTIGSGGAVSTVSAASLVALVV
jgi:hypothetical protein